MKSKIQIDLSKLFNSLTLEERKGSAGIGYSLGQLTTIIQIRDSNKRAWEESDKELARWQKNVEAEIQADFLGAQKALAGGEG